MSHIDEKPLLKKIAEVDEGFKTWRVLLTWRFVLGMIPFLLLYIAGGWSVLIAGQLNDVVLIVALLAFSIAILALMIQWVDFYYRETKSWVIATNYRHLKKKGEKDTQDLILYGLIAMKAKAPRIKLKTVWETNTALFEPKALTARIYEE